MSNEDVPSTSDSAKLAVFRNLDIMDTILDAMLVKYIPYPSERKHLLQAALTAKNFFDPAMNILWRSLDSILPVLKLIPDFKIQMDPTVDGWKYYTTTKAISEEDLARFRWYCQRVRNLTLPNKSGSFHPRISSHIYSSLGDFCPSGLFPALKRFNVDLDELPPDHLHLYSLLLIPTPTLSHVLCSGISQLSEVHVATFFTRLSKIKSQSLKHLYLGGRLTLSTLDTLPRSPRVTTLDLDMSDMTVPVDNMIEAISNLRALRRLTLTFWNHDTLDPWTNLAAVAPVTISTFEQLYQLQIDGNDARQLCTFLTTAIKYTPFLRNLVLHLDDEDEDSRDDLKTATLLRQCFQDATRYAPSLDICMIEVGTAVHWRTLEHIQDWKTLKYLHIIVPTLVLEDRQSADRPCFFNGLATLRKLTFHADVWKQHGKILPLANLSLLSLSDISKSCPKLYRLKIYIPLQTLVTDAVVASMESILRESPKPHSKRAPAVPPKLQELVFLRSSRPLDPGGPAFQKPSMQHSVVVGEFLNFLYPKLQKVDFQEVASLLGDDWCNSVSTTLSSFKKCRSDVEKS